ncbi:hypothetical protein B0H13DRAFT_2340952 [Mycena leptocephala]|nr:hypothetical protein B0H13DRAFT_2340952 [Mycena leptocephala]
MSLLRFLVYTLFVNGRPVLGHHLDSRGPTDSCDDINSCRKPFDIIWGCLTTIFACTWVSVHPNVPAPNHRGIFWRRLRLMLLAVIAPQLMVGFAIRQFIVARRYSREFHLSLTHGFFISMGGFVSRNGHHAITTSKQVTDPQYLSAIRSVEVETIEDKSKGDLVSTGVAVQAVWMVVQCMARAQQGLPITALEITTMAFTATSVFSWGFWLMKPLDVEQPILVGPQDESLDAETTTKLSRGLWYGICGAITGSYYDYQPTLSTSVPSCWSAHDDEKTRLQWTLCLAVECIFGTWYGIFHLAVLGVNAGFPSTYELWLWTSSSLVITVIPVVFALARMALMHLSDRNSPTARTILAIIVLLTIPIYLIARLVTMILPLTALRALPPGTFRDVNWTAYIPHF